MAEKSDLPLILVVDDDAEVLRLLTSGLGSRGFRVQTAKNGREGMNMVRAEVPRLIVLDYWMPVLDGAGFMTELRALLPHRPPVILFTAVQDKPELARQLGVDVYVEKPVQISRFVKLVEATLRGAKEWPENTPTPVGTQRRRYKRLVHRRAVEVRLPGQVRFSQAFIVDLSEGGLCLELGESPAPVLSLDAHVGVAVRLRDGRRVELDGLVRHAASGRVGVQFLPLDATRAAAVLDLLSEAAPRN